MMHARSSNSQDQVVENFHPASMKELDEMKLQLIVLDLGLLKFTVQLLHFIISCTHNDRNSVYFH